MCRDARGGRPRRGQRRSAPRARRARGAGRRAAPARRPRRGITCEPAAVARRTAALTCRLKTRPPPGVSRASLKVPPASRADLGVRGALLASPPSPLLPPRAPLTHSGELGVGTRVCATLRNKRPQSESSGAGGFPSPSALDALGPRPGSAPGTAPPLRGWRSTGTSGTRVNATSQRPGPRHAQTLLGPTRQALDAGKGFWVAERGCGSSKRRATLRRSAAL